MASFFVYPQLDACLVELVELRAAVEVDADPDKPLQEFEALRKLIHQAAEEVAAAIGKSAVAMSQVRNAREAEVLCKGIATPAATLVSAGQLLVRHHGRTFTHDVRNVVGRIMDAAIGAYLKAAPRNPAFRIRADAAKAAPGAPSSGAGEGGDCSDVAHRASLAAGAAGDGSEAEMARRRVQAAGVLQELVAKAGDLPRSDASAAIRRLTGATRCMRQAALEMFERAPDGPTPQELREAVEALQAPSAGGGPASGVAPSEGTPGRAGDAAPGAGAGEKGGSSSGGGPWDRPAEELDCAEFDDWSDDEEDAEWRQDPVCRQRWWCALKSFKATRNLFQYGVELLNLIGLRVRKNRKARAAKAKKEQEEMQTPEGRARAAYLSKRKGGAKAKGAAGGAASGAGGRKKRKRGGGKKKAGGSGSKPPAASAPTAGAAAGAQAKATDGADDDESASAKAAPTLAAAAASVAAEISQAGPLGSRRPATAVPREDTAAFLARAEEAAKQPSVRGQLRPDWHEASWHHLVRWFDGVADAAAVVERGVAVLADAADDPSEPDALREGEKAYREAVAALSLALVGSVAGPAAAASEGAGDTGGEDSAAAREAAACKLDALPLPLPDIHWKHVQAAGLDPITLHLIRETARKSLESLDALGETLSVEGLRRVVGLDESRVAVGFMMGGGAVVAEGDAPPEVPILAESGAPPRKGSVVEVEGGAGGEAEGKEGSGSGSAAAGGAARDGGAEVEGKGEEGS